MGHRFKDIVSAINTCHLLFPKRTDLVTFDFLSPLVESNRLLSPLRVHSNVIDEDSEYSESMSILSIELVWSYSRFLYVIRSDNERQQHTLFDVKPGCRSERVRR